MYIIVIVLYIRPNRIICLIFALLLLFSLLSFILYISVLFIFFFFFQAEDGIRDGRVTGVQTCALPILHDAGDLVVAGRALGYQVEKLGPFTRVTAPAQFARNPVVLGTAFGLRRGERSGLVAGETGWFVLQTLARTGADSAAWLKQRDQQRESLLRPVEQARLQQFIAALRADATIVDRRSETFRPAAASQS